MAPQEVTHTPTGLPDGVTKPVASINADDQSGLIAILTAFSLALVLLSIATRIYVRHDFRVYRTDDAAFFAAAVCIYLAGSSRYIASNLNRFLQSYKPRWFLMSFTKVSGKQKVEKNHQPLQRFKR